MDTTYIMLKNQPVLEINNYNCKILDYDHLPISLRYEGVMYDDVMHGWTESRTMHIGKTNAKKILTGFNIRQSNPYMIAKLFHFASLSDCYWMKEKAENLTWKDVSLFQNDFAEAVSATALLGINQSFRDISHKIHTPELTAQGMAAKAWIREGNEIYLYKVGKREIAASMILDALQIPHVSYTKVPDRDLYRFADEQHIRKISDKGEAIVKCKIITSEELSLVTWEDFQMYCDYHDINEFEYIKNHDGQAYYSMQVADYILGNEDRHGANFGFYMDNSTGKLLNLYPLMDHDHAFSNDTDIPSQTSENNELLKEAAIHAIKKLSLDLSCLLTLEKPYGINENQWQGVRNRTLELQKANINIH